MSLKKVPCSSCNYHSVVIDTTVKSKDNFIYSLLHKCPKCLVIDYIFFQNKINHLSNDNFLEKYFQHHFEVEDNARKKYYTTWKRKFNKISDPKKLWNILTLNGFFYPTFQTFKRNIAKSNNIFDVKRYLNKFFQYNELKRIFQVCEISPDWKYLNTYPIEEILFQPDSNNILEFLNTNIKGKIDFSDLEIIVNKTDIYSNAEPSKVDDIHWLYADRKISLYPEKNNDEKNLTPLHIPANPATHSGFYLPPLSH